ncbi:hypothetical protein VBZ51_13590 [Maribacter sp. HS]|uniref:hypothetical protein n=1 Tax=Maribacter sp. HS TaxID=3110480 RepID=UPI003A866472
MRKTTIIFIFLIFIGIYSCGVDAEVLEYQKNTIHLLYPEDNSEVNEGIILTDTTNTLEFKWESSTEDENQIFYLELTNLDNKTVQVYESTGNKASIPLKRNNSYSWAVSDSINHGSSLWTFKNIGPWETSTAPLAAIAISPVSGASISQTSTTVNLIWKGEDEDNDILNYDLYFGESEIPEIFIENIETTRYNDIPVEAGNTYYWKIVTRDYVGNETSSSVFNFNVGN